jgi:anti-anti-sigma factor
MEIKVTTENARVPVTVMNINGDIDSGTYQIFQARADELIADGAGYILINMADMPFISSAGLRSLHNIFSKLRSLHKDVSDDELRKKMNEGSYKSPYIKVANLSSHVREIFELTGFETYMEIHADLNTAIASF